MIVVDMQLLDALYLTAEIRLPQTKPAFGGMFVGKCVHTLGYRAGIVNLQQKTNNN